MQEYECHQCKSIFTESEPPSSKGKADIKCPACGSTDVESLDSSDGFFDFVCRIMSPGKG